MQCGNIFASVLAMNEIGLVLEGGGMRGVFTSGVTDAFLKHEILFNYVAGTSAGTSNGLSYAARQQGRAHYCNIEALRKYNYIGLKFLFTQGCIMDYKYMFNELPLREYPFDFQTYLKSGRFVLTATDCITGKTCYFDTPQTEDLLLDVCKASCSMPLFCPIVYVQGRPYLDGGIADAIPLSKANADGYQKCVVVLTRRYGYRKNENWKWLSWFYYKYPNLRKALIEKSACYNATISRIEQLEKEGQIFVIRPTIKLAGRLNSNSDELQKLYENGVEQVEKNLANLEKFLGK